jgi:hypothetical protein
VVTEEKCIWLRRRSPYTRLAIAYAGAISARTSLPLQLRFGVTTRISNAQHRSGRSTINEMLLNGRTSMVDGSTGDFEKTAAIAIANDVVDVTT